MKKLFVALVALVGMSLVAEAQDRCRYRHEFISNKHEVKVNTLSGILLMKPELSYEYILNQNISLGGRVGFSYANKEERDLVLQVSPYVRWNFFKGHLKNSDSERGFFTELNASYNLIDRPIYDAVNDIHKESYTSAFGMGIGVGYKYISRRHWIVEPSINATRIFSSEINDIYVTPAITIGKQF